MSCWCKHINPVPMLMDKSMLVFNTWNLQIPFFVSDVFSADCRAGTIISEGWEDGQALKDLNAHLVSSCELIFLHVKVYMEYCMYLHPTTMLCQLMHKSSC